uniref:Microtubule-associated protein 10 C-terminal domain-containing protein n=1 Tax=Denticeps clupeoides TaxID=299321 RepID=A0AAY4EAF3_9TELE
MISSDESLFAFECFVHHVRLDDGSRPGPGVDLAVGMRLLDFPTVMIYQFGSQPLSDKKPAEETSQQSASHFSFLKGKSCLFKTSLGFLLTHLSCTPLYATVLNVAGDVPTFIGSSLISLATIIGQIKADVDANDINTPSAFGKKDVHGVYNLMGEKIGTMSVNYRLVNLGITVAPHVSREGAAEQNWTQIKNVDPDALLPEDRNSQNVHVNGRPPVVEAEKVRAVSAGTQTEIGRKHVRTTEVVTVIAHKEEPGPGVFCPPPLFYRRAGKKQEGAGGEQYRVVRLDSLRVEDSEENSSEVQAAVHSKDQIGADGAPGGPEAQQRLAQNPLVDALRQLPLLNALLFELSQLSDRSRQQALTVHPNLAWLYTPAQEPSATDVRPEIKSSEMAPQLKARRSPKLSDPHEPALPHQTQPATAKHQPKRTLRIGLTRTVRLRHQQINTGESKGRECVERSGPGLLKPGNKNPLTKTRLRPSSSRSTELDRNINTVISSDNAGEPLQKPRRSTGPLPSGRYSHQSKHTGASFKKPDDFSAGTPSMLSQRSGPVNVSDHAGYHSQTPESCGLNSDVQEDRSPSVSRTNSALLKPSDLSIDEQHEYQDDFTSLDFSEGGSLEALSSPEVGFQRPHSTQMSSSINSSSDRTSSRKSVLPVPVKVDTSPQWSSKSSRPVHARLPNTLPSGDSDLGPPSRAQSSLSGHLHRTSLDGESESGPKPKCGRGDSEDYIKGRSHSGDTSPWASDESISFSNQSHESDELGSLGFDKKYKHISELAVKKLPGYTL